MHFFYARAHYIV